jgi:hypothetical protein
MLLLRDSSADVNGDCNGGKVRGMPVVAMTSMQSLVYADVDGDGDDDVLGVTSSSHIALLVNNGSGYFVNATLASGLLVASNRASAVTVGDIDGDGDVDVFVSATSASSVLMQNNGSGGFADVSAASLRTNRTGTFRQSTMLDVDGDGDLDLFVPTSSGNRLYVNSGNGTLVESGASRGVASYTGNGSVRGSAAADVDGDGDVDVLVFGSGPQQLYMNNGSGWFVDRAASRLALVTDVASASFGDIDNDGDADLLMGASSSPSAVAANNGSGVFSIAAAVTTALGSATVTNPVFVDVDADGDVDIPAVDFVNGVVAPGFVGAGAVASIRVLSRAGGRTCHGVSIVVRRSSDAAVVVSRTVSSGTAPYDVHVALPTGGLIDIEVTFPSGRRHNKATQAALAGLPLLANSSTAVPVFVVRDTPAIVSVLLSPSSGVSGPGSTITATVRSLGGEAGLLAAPTCTMNGVNVTASMMDWRNGTYSFNYTVAQTHASVLSLPVRLGLVDARWGVSSDAVSLVSGSVVSIDTIPPLVSFNATPNCSVDLGGVSATVYQRLCISCGSLSAEPFGCAIWMRVNATASPLRIAASRANNSVAVMVGPYTTGDRPAVEAWAEDTAGNVGPRAVLTWEVDLTPPETLWLPHNPPPHTNATSLLFSFGCTRTGCSFDYSFGSSPRMRLGATVADSVRVAGSIDTALASLPRRFSPQRTASISVAARLNGAMIVVDSRSGNSTVEVRVDSGAWTDVRALTSFDSVTQRLSLSGLPDGQHTLQARASSSEAGLDLSPWTHVWSVDTVSPTVSFVVAPPQLSATPRCTALFVLVADEEDASFEVQWRAVNSSAGDDGNTTRSVWQPVNGSTWPVSGLLAVTPYVLHARARDRAGNVGGVASWRWSSAGCPPVASVALTLTVQSFAYGVDSRTVLWSAAAEALSPTEVQYRLNDGPWIRTSERTIVVRSLNATTHYRVDVRPAVPCGCEGMIPEQAWSSASWYMYDSAPGLPSIVSAPSLSSSSLFGDFELNSTAWDSWFEYSLDGGSFAGCSSRLRVGPLSTGPHNVTVRSVDVNGAFRANAEVTHAWTVVSSSSSSLELTDMRDGEQSLKVWAVKGSSEEVAPRTVKWTVDTEAPGVSATLVTPVATNGSIAILNVSCVGEAFPSLCVHCASTTTGDGSANQRFCSSSNSLVASMAEDGVYEARVSAIDAAGNEGKVTLLTWTRDSTAPDTSAAVNASRTPLFSVPLLSVAATNTSMVVFTASSSEVQGGLAVTLDDVAVLAGLMPGPTIVVNFSTDGLHTVVIRAVDAVGNADETPVVTRLLVDTTTPSTSVVARPAAVSNKSTAVVSWRAYGEIPGSLSGFQLSSVPALAILPSFTAPDDGGMALSLTLTLAGLASNEYTLTARAVDAVGHVDVSGATFSFVVDLDAPTSRLTHSLTPFVNRSAHAVSVDTSDTLSSVLAFVRVDGGAWQSVPSSVVSLTLADGTHRIECRGVDAAGNAQPPPYDGVNVTVDTAPPIVSVAPDTVPTFNSLSVVSVAVTVSDMTSTVLRGVLDESLDSVVSRLGSGVVRVGVAADGNHTLVLNSEDAAGNVGTAVSVSWFTDRVSPVTAASLTDTASAFIRDASVNVSLLCVNEAFPQLCVACWHYTLVSASGAALSSNGRCESTSTLSFAHTLDGVANVDVYSVDAAGNAGGNASRVSWVWDRTAPATTVSVAGGTWLPTLDAWVVNNASVTLLLSSSESMVTFEVSVDGIVQYSVVNASSFHQLELELAAGRRVLGASAVDLSGNVGSAASVAIVVDTTPPQQPRFTLLHQRGCFVLPQYLVFVCNSSGAVAFDAGCSDNDSLSSRERAPCFVQWHIDTVSLSLPSTASDAGGGCVLDDGGGTRASDGLWARANGSLLLPALSRDGQYRVWWRAADDAGNVGVANNMLLWLDTTPPLSSPSFITTPDTVSFLTTARFEVQMVGDSSPGRLSFVYELTRGDVVESLATASLPEPKNDDVVQLLLGGLVGDLSYTLRVWTQDQAGHRSSKAALHVWAVATVAPTVQVVLRPSPISSLVRPRFAFSAVWGNNTARRGVVPDASFLVSLVGVSAPHSPCEERLPVTGTPSSCSSWCNGTRCEYSPRLDAPQAYTLQVQAVLGGRAGDVVAVQWEYHRCRSDQFAIITNGDAIECRSCPGGGDCTPLSSTDVVTQADIVARAGYWASPSSDGSRFYRCPILGACVGGGNGSRAVCATGYDHVACSLCADGYFEQFGLCVVCPKSSAASIGALLGLSLLLIAICVGLYLVRELLPIDVVKLGVSMVQIIASANSAYDIPWPSTFRQFLSLLRVFLVDVVAITQASCAQPMNYYASMMVVCVGLKLALALLLLAPWAWSKLSARGCRITRAVQDAQVRRKVSTVEASMALEGRRRSSLTKGMAAALAAAQSQVGRINWTDVFKASFMLLFIAYPGVSLKVLRLFKCREIEGEWWLAADMRLRCYDGRWAGFAIYGIMMAIVYILGLPASVLWILWRRRHKLFGSPTDPFVASTRETFGFLYADYGSSAWWWEVEELLRKLLLSAVVVLIDEGSPLQVTLAVLVSGWAHVLHAQYKPWGAGSMLYSLQHGALFVTSFVFLMGLLFKVDGVSSSSGTYKALSSVMVTLCVLFVTAWVVVVASRVVSLWRASKRSKVPALRPGKVPQVCVAASPTTSHSREGPGSVLGVDLPVTVGGNFSLDSHGASGVRLSLMVTLDLANADSHVAAPNAGSDHGEAAHIESLSSESANGFMIDNPLRRPIAGARFLGGIAGDDSTRTGRSAALNAANSEQSLVDSGATVAMSSSQRRTGTTAVTVTPRLLRVLAAQRPVQSARTVLSVEPPQP